MSRNLFFSLPDHIVVSITKLVSRDGFEYLGPLIASGKQGMSYAFSDDVLKEASLHNLLSSPSLVNRWSKYYPFLSRCVNAGNVVGCYLESLRLATREGKIDEAIELLMKTSPLSDEMEFALGIFQITRGHYRVGRQRLDSFTLRVGSYDRAEEVAELVFQRIRSIGPTRVPSNVSKPYCTTWKFEKVPTCGGTACFCTPGHRCEDCFAWGRSIQFFMMFLR